MFSVFNLRSYIYSLATLSSKITVGALLNCIGFKFHMQCVALYVIGIGMH